MPDEITVSWSFVLPGFEAEPEVANATLLLKADRGDVAPVVYEADRVLPLGSSVVAPGLGLFMPV